jgi:hypothetical protein
LGQILKRETTEAVKIENLVRRLSVGNVVPPQSICSLLDAIIAFCAGTKIEEAEEIFARNIGKKLATPIIYIFPIIHYLLFEKSSTKHAEAVFVAGLGGSNACTQELALQEAELLSLYQKIIDFHRINVHSNAGQTLSDLAKRERANFLRDWLNSVPLKEDLAKAVRAILLGRLGMKLDLMFVKNLLRAQAGVFDEFLVEGYNIPLTTDLITDNPVSEYYAREAEQIDRAVSEVNRLSSKLEDLKRRKRILKNVWNYLSLSLGLVGLVPVILFVLRLLHVLSSTPTYFSLFFALLTVNLVLERKFPGKALGTLFEYFIIVRPEYSLRKKIDKFSDAGKRASMLFTE